MKLISVAILTVGLAALAGEEPASQVNPFIGCSYNGHCYAAAAYPFGLVQAGPDTGNTWWDYCSGYRYADERILGFSQTHISGTGCGDLGDLLVMPFTGEFDHSRTNYTSRYRKETQQAKPGYYAVTLDDNHAHVEVAVTHHAAIYRIQYLGNATPRLFADLQYGILNWNAKDAGRRVLECDVEQVDSRSFSGRLRTKIWVDREYSFALEFDHDVNDIYQLPPRVETENGPRGILSFDMPSGGTLMMKVAFSTVSPDAAARNLAAEIPGWDFDGVRAAATKAWNETLGRAELVGGTPDMRTNWYTSLYHLFLQPADITDVDGAYRGADGQVAKAPGGHYYSTLSLWDTFRAAHPLYTILAPERVDGFVGTMLEHARAAGFLPIWTLWGKDNQCMIGNHSIPVIVDAYLKGFRGFDAEQAYAAIRKTLTEDAPGRRFNFTDVWKKYGYYPFDIVKTESVSRTLEHAYDDWCAARFAEALGKKDDAAYFDRRANNWTNVFDRSVGFARGRDTKGNWREPFSPFKLNVGGRGTGPKDFTEGNSWQYTWHVMQDPRGLVAAMGGKEKFLKNLNGLFSQPEKVEGMGFALDATGLVGQYAHGNEPSHHTIYLFQYAGRPDRTAELVREVCDRFYRPEPDGLCGNDDCGQMSAWYLFSAMGFYPLNPCGGDYVLGAPQVPKVVIHLGGSQLVATADAMNCVPPHTFTVVAKNLSKENKYVKSVTLNGKPLDAPILRHADIMRGGELVFEMTGVQVPPPAFVTQEDAFEEKCDGAFWHVQGIAISDDAVYCGLLKNIVKFDLATGKCLKGVPAPSHTGDVCWHNGRLYTSVLANFEAARKNQSAGRGVIQVYDADLNLIRAREFPMGFDGIAALDGVLYLGRGVAGDGISRTCRIVRLKEETLEFIDEVEIEPGFDFRSAVQDIATDGRHLFFSFYPVKGPVGIAVYTKDLRLVKTLPETFSNGFDRLPGRFQRPGAPTLFGVLRSFTRKDAQGLAVPGYSAYLQTFAWDGKALRDVTPPSALALRDRPSRWLNLFNGKDLSGWTPKIRGYKAGENPGNTFRVVDGCLCNRYDDPMYADGFKQRFGHLFYNRPFSNYVLRATYRMPLPQVKGGEGWAVYNNGIMLHGQTPESMDLDQPFPVSIEYQLLSRARKGQARSTANLCTPGTNVEKDGKLYTPHVLNSTSRTCEPDAWTTVEAEVRGGERIIHRLDGRTVLEYEKPQYDPRDGSAKKLIEVAGGDLILRGGTISIQSESAPTDFKSILVRPLVQEPSVALP